MNIVDNWLGCCKSHLPAQTHVLLAHTLSISIPHPLPAQIKNLFLALIIPYVIKRVRGGNSDEQYFEITQRSADFQMLHQKVTISNVSRTKFPNASL